MHTILLAFWWFSITHSMRIFQLSMFHFNKVLLITCWKQGSWSVVHIILFLPTKNCVITKGWAGLPKKRIIFFPNRIINRCWFVERECRWDGCNTHIDASLILVSPSNIHRTVPQYTHALSFMMRAIVCSPWAPLGNCDPSRKPISGLPAPQPCTAQWHTPPEWATCQKSWPEKWYTTYCQGPLGLPNNAFGKIWELNFF